MNVVLAAVVGIDLAAVGLVSMLAAGVINIGVPEAARGYLETVGNLMIAGTNAVVAIVAANKIHRFVLPNSSQVAFHGATTTKMLAAYWAMSGFMGGWFVLKPHLCSTGLARHATLFVMPTCLSQGVVQIFVKALHAGALWMCFYTTTLAAKHRTAEREGRP